MRETWRLRLRGGVQRWTSPMPPDPTDAARWEAFCQTIGSRIEAVRREADINDGSDTWRTFVPPITTPLIVWPLAVGPAAPWPDFPRDAHGRYRAKRSA